MNGAGLALFVKEPVPGRVKTRLIPPLSPSEAASLYRSWACGTFAMLGGLENAAVRVAYEPFTPGSAPVWLSDHGADAPFFLQEGDGLGERMKHAFENLFSDGFNRAILIGSDSPGLPLDYVRDGFCALESHDLVLGPAQDGGYYLIGLKGKFPARLFDGVEWSTEKVYEQTRQNAKRAGLSLHRLPEYFDIDRPQDLVRISKKISVILPVLNEAGVIEKRIQSLRDQARGFQVEVIAVDGGSSDGSLEKAKALADVAVEFVRPSRGGQMHAGALKASGDVLFFLHADTDLPPGWVWTLLSAFSGNGIAPVAAAFELGFDSDRIKLKIITILARFRNRLTGVPQGDQGLAVERKAYFESGGFPDSPLMEEYLFIPRLRKLGKVKILDGTVKTSARKYEKNGPFTNALLNFKTLLLFYAGVPAEKLARRYRSR